MSKVLAPQLTAIDGDTLAPLVQSALASETAAVIDWDYEQLHAGAGAVTAVYRFSGDGCDQDRTIPWSLILKVLTPPGGSTNVSAWNYYKREADAYRSGWFDNLPGGIVAPRSFGLVEFPDGTCWIWLEVITDEIGPEWPLEHYGLVARHFGQFNGAYLAGWLQPGWSWLGLGWLRKYVADSAPAIVPLRNSLEHPLVRCWLPADTSDNFFRLWAERDIFLDALDRLPQTLCHLDGFRRNLFARRASDGSNQTVAVDWAYTARAAIGEELVPLIQGSLKFFEVELDQAQTLEEIVFEGYLKGLRDAGWQGDPRQVRLGYAAASTLRYPFGEIGRILALILDESRHGIAQQILGHSIEEMLDRWARVQRFFDSLTDEARDLKDALGL